ncbi:WD40-repeat-containing domain protein [Paraphysoderma sedebokerense]|nr:WD40-repeat-containing domain protein [Paraphysoderma sedebokerense]KAI9137849.1 WD40-repeat-containing domain protein [Paraphysoderma sedebokerense]
MLHQICPQTPSKVIGIGGTPVSKKPRVIFPQSTILNEVYNSSPFDRQATYMITRPQHPTRFIPKGPFKVLDAPDLQDDFYLNLVDWSSSNLLGVGLGNCVYLWNANTCNVTKLCEVGPYDSITSVNWNQRGNLLSVGTNKGAVLLWDAQRQTCLREYQNHTSRVGALAWNNNLFSSGSRDRHIIHHDVRTPNQYTKKLSAHKQEVCGLRWNEATDTLASGGNDNKLFVWEKVNEQPLRKFDKHQAAVKALAWSPRNPSILASGGGTADRTIRFWDVQQGTCIKSVETNSQVCNLAFSKNSEELVSTHGYSQNQIVVWSEPEMEQLAVLTGHTYRVLYLAMSPDGESIVTGAGDETLRFWRVFEKGRPIVQPTHGQWSHIR